MAQYQVTGECAHLIVDSPEGPRHQLVYKGTVLPDGVPQDRIRHLLSVNLIRRVEQESDLIAPAAPAPAAPTATDDGTGDGGETPSPAETSYDDPERVAAREKLPADGSLPDGRAALAVWVEAAVARGYAYEAAKGTGKPELIDLLRRPEQ